MSLKVYNSLSNEKEEFVPIDEDLVRMYICGQTVYDYMHIGHARTYVAFDIIRRYLEHKGYSVKTVINITDVNDKINDRAKDESRSPWEVAEEFATINLEDYRSLNIRADAHPKASEYMQEMIDLVRAIEEEGIAYEVEGDVFFDTTKFPDYGKLSNQDMENMESAREEDIVSIEKKRNPQDFVLWKSREGSEYSPTWDSPWGEGIPGWHIECSAMSMSLLGERMDIHGGGSDLTFPHHENETAQVEGVTGERWVKYWMHTGLVRIKEEKMSKSLSNFVPAREVLEDYGSEAIRLMVASSHYREPMDYSDEKMEEASRNVQSLKTTLEDIRAEIRASKKIPDKLNEDDREFLDEIFNLRAEFMAAMNDDFNTPRALKNIYELEKSVNSYLSKNPKRTVLERSEETFIELCSILGILPEKEVEKNETSKLEKVVKEILELREELREKGDYETADSIRNALEKTGVKVEDTDRGPRIKNL